MDRLTNVAIFNRSALRALKNTLQKHAEHVGCLITSVNLKFIYVVGKTIIDRDINGASLLRSSNKKTFRV
jgi:hypothetical protein